MVYTVTFNPSLDYVLRVDAFRPGETNRSAAEELVPGGKGINVAAVLTNLGVPCCALGFVGGFVGEEVERALRARGIRTAFVRIDARTRINVKLKSAGAAALRSAETAAGSSAGESRSSAEEPCSSAGKSCSAAAGTAARALNARLPEEEGPRVETEINAAGPELPESALAALVRQLEDIPEGSWLVLAGNVPRGVPSDVYGRLLRRLAGRGLHAVVDATGELLRAALPERPVLVKPNRAELAELAGRPLITEEDVFAAAEEVRAMGAQNVVVSLGAEGALMAAADGSRMRLAAPTGMLVDSVGAGDSLVAGFLAALLKGASLAEAFCTGVAAGSATAFRHGLAERADVERLLARMDCKSKPELGDDKNDVEKLPAQMD